ncbi:hypothetical protein EV363DRAFT_1395053 [Boletus edulis]|uniref:Secreted protein n=1 Tax=Boletus edulis BED1 TaxID=1328754 RepID=A0AAD4BR47_BOLED|nr:hypothetical protein EV363DRAFT_1395053 [Boletus edulis]KAF8438067.1 hypothetical protein L210DRAFT_2303303 [Boletus edulis BED1]
MAGIRWLAGLIMWLAACQLAIRLPGTMMTRSHGFLPPRAPRSSEAEVGSQRLTDECKGMGRSSYPRAVHGADNVHRWGMRQQTQSRGTTRGALGC